MYGHCKKFNKYTIAFLRLIFERFQIHGLLVNANKCTLANRIILFLVHMVLSEGLYPSETDANSRLNFKV